MIRDEEQKAQELEQEIALMQREGQLGLQHGPPLQQRAQVEDLYIPQRSHAIPHVAAFQGVNYLDERSPLAPHLQVSPWAANFRVGTYPKYNGSTDPAQYIMSYQVAVASSGGDDATMAKSFIIALEGPALIWYTRLPPLSIDSWRSLWDKFLLNFQGYRPDTDALAELSLCKQLEKETLREYYRKFLTLKSQLPSVDDQIAIHYAISGLRAGVLYSHCIRDPPKNLQELYQLFEKYARSEELHQSKVESQRKPKDTPQSSRTWTRPSQADSGQDGCNQQQVHNIANQNPAGEAPRRQEYPPRAVEMELVVGARDARSSRADFTACSTMKTVPTLQETAQKRRPPETGWHERNQPTTLELLRTHINNPLSHTTTAPLRIHRTTHTNTTRRYKLYLPHPTSTPATAKCPPPQPPPSPKARRLRQSAVSQSHSYDHWGVQRRHRHKAVEEGPLPQHQPRRRHRSSRADKVVPCASDLRRPRRRSAQRTTHRRHGYQLQRGRMGSAQSLSRQWQLGGYHFPPCLRSHGHKPQPAQAFGQPTVWLRRQGHLFCRQNIVTPLLRCSTQCPK
jgi:hypothetical protein